MHFVKATYLAGENPQFDFDYYMSVHLPLAAKYMAAWNLHHVRREIQMHCRDLFDPGARAPVLSLTYYFEDQKSISLFESVLRSPEVEELKADVARYTNCAISWTTGEVKVL